jgi:hypothetical protein
MGARVRELPPAKDQDPIRPADLAEPVRDDESRAPPGNAEQGALDLVLRGAVDGARGIVEDQDARVREEGARYGDPLLLPFSSRETNSSA